MEDFTRGLFLFVGIVSIVGVIANLFDLTKPVNKGSFGIFSLFIVTIAQGIEFICNTIGVWILTASGLFPWWVGVLSIAVIVTIIVFFLRPSNIKKLSEIAKESAQHANEILSQGSASYDTGKKTFHEILLSVMVIVLEASMALIVMGIIKV